MYIGFVRGGPYGHGVGSSAERNISMLDRKEGRNDGENERKREREREIKKERDGDLKRKIEKEKERDFWKD
jgi:hypothetical protein